jgi:uncharacterized protein DUF551
MTINDLETIAWIAVADSLPDADTTVLVFAPGMDEQVWLGFYDGCYWFGVDAVEYGDEEAEPTRPRVTHWADIPAGPVR